ncbi:MAG: 7TM diverse intracellular signaling domain-containing protein, partial [Ketobacteraceae bacterium]|nr:7TM diverse intracellular signaling domain-containing protein [Ketobacteraceae bacterium]
MRLWLVTIVVLYLLSDQVLAADLNLTPQADYFFDVGNQYKIDTIVREQTQIPWQRNHDKSLNLAFSDATVWLRMPIETDITRPPALFEVAWPFIDRLQAFWVTEAGIEDLGVQGDHFRRSSQYLQHRFFVYPVPGENRLEGQLFLKINTTSSILLPMKLWEPESFFYKESRQQIFLGFFYGLLTIILIYNLGMWFYVRDHVYLYYVGYLSFVCIYIGSLTGVGPQYLWGNSPAFSDIALLIGVLGSFVFGSFFVDSFLQLSKNNPVAHRLIIAAIGIYCLLIVGYFLTSEATITPIGQALGIVASVFAYIVGIMEWRKGNPDARYFTIAWSMLLLGTCIYTLYLAGWLPGNTVIRNIQISGLVVEMALLSFALGERFTRERAAAKQATEVALHLASEVNKSHEEKIRLQEQANLELEAKVIERTRELQNTLTCLEDANRKLEALSNTDQLTGLKNRRYFTKYYEEEFKRSIRSQQPISIVVLDIDHFKRVNDTYGHLAGDWCLKQVAEVIQI